MIATRAGHIQAIVDAHADGQRAGQATERAAVVAWLREQARGGFAGAMAGDAAVAGAALRGAASCIEAGYHLANGTRDAMHLHHGSRPRRVRGMVRTMIPQSLQDADDAASDGAQYVESTLWALHRGDRSEALACLRLALSAAASAHHLIQRALGELATKSAETVATEKSRPELQSPTGQDSNDIE